MLAKLLVPMGYVSVEYLFGRAFGVDVRKVGSGNTTRSSMLRYVVKWTGVLASLGNLRIRF